ncbi:MAG: biotin/lipoyl-binding protein, partial [Acetobacteraceae bacterium]
MRWKRLLWLLPLLAALGGLLAWRALPPAVTVAAATTGPAVEAVYATGSVEPVTLARVGPGVRARLVAVLAEEGERVAQGQALARLDDREARARLEEAEARA